MGARDGGTSRVVEVVYNTIDEMHRQTDSRRGCGAGRSHDVSLVRMRSEQVHLGTCTCGVID